MPTIYLKGKGTYTFENSEFQFCYYDSGDLHGNDNFRALDVTPSIYEIINRIDPTLLETALAAVMDNTLVPLTQKVENDCTLDIVTCEKKEGRYIYHNSLAFLLAQTIFELAPTSKLLDVVVTDEACNLNFDMDVSSDLDGETIEAYLSALLKTKIAIQTVYGMQKETLLENYPSLSQPYAQNFMQSYDAYDFVTVAIHNQFALPIGEKEFIIPNPLVIKNFKLKTTIDNMDLHLEGRLCLT